MVAHLKGTAIKTSIGGAGAESFDRGETALRAADGESARLEAIAWHGRAAKLGYAPSQYRLALLYAEDDSSSAAGRDALAWAERAADQGLPDAVFLKGLFVYHGVGQGRNRTEGVDLMLDAAERGHGEAQYVSGRRLLAEEWRPTKAMVQ
ncbi:MAG: sel1 repeat family protein [Rhodospirillales bacterium]|nr:sel1 repeat family protein [Rhodospirillales bacterium]